MADLNVECEVKCPETWAWYQGYVTDYSESSGHVQVRYPNDWKQPEEVDSRMVRQKYTQPLDEWDPQLNEEVECKARAEVFEPHGWWLSTIQNISVSEGANDTLYTVSFVGWGDTEIDTVSRSFIRQKSRADALSTDDILSKTKHSRHRTEREDHDDDDDDDDDGKDSSDGAAASFGVSNKNTLEALRMELDFARNRLSELQDMNDTLNAKNTKLLTMDLESLNSLSSKLLDNLKKVNRAKERLQLCILCVDRRRNISFEGCSHFVVCAECEDRMEEKQCPVCREPYGGTKQLMF